MTYPTNATYMAAVATAWAGSATRMTLSILIGCASPSKEEGQLISRMTTSLPHPAAQVADLDVQVPEQLCCARARSKRSPRFAVRSLRASCSQLSW